jgi:hypothetical protein
VIARTFLLLLLAFPAAARYTLASATANAVTAPYRIPGTNGVSFVVQRGDEKKLARTDLGDDRGSLTRELVTIPFPTSGAHTWTSRGTLVMASGNEIREWDPNRPEEWPVVARFSEPELQGITRIALSPDERLIALVSTPGDLTVLRESRAASNAEFAESVARYRGTSWTRTPERFDIEGDTATERGTSVRRWSDAVVTGEYMVLWRRTIGSNGTPSWSAQFEQYAPR